jgi:hypothetical protein
MSEYQYYEFAAVDRPLTKAQMAKLRALSTRARITPTRFVNEYHWGNFKGRPKKMMEEFFDGHLYVANWGTRNLYLRLPVALLDRATVEDYLVDDGFEAWEAHGKLILSFTHDNDEGGYEDDEEWGGDEDYDDYEDYDEEGCDRPPGSLGVLLQLRAELARGDLRPLYLGWLSGVGRRGADDGMAGPPVPPGLGELTGAQQELARFLRIDADLLAAAAEKSGPPKPGADAARLDAEALRAWVAALSAAQKEAWLLRLAGGDDAGGNAPAAVAAEVRGGFLAACRARERTREGHAMAATDASAANRPTAGALVRRAKEIAAARAKREAEEAAREKERRAREAAAAREKHLDRQAAREHELWPEVHTRIAMRLPKSYDEAVALLADLHDLARRRGGPGLAGFMARLRELKAAHARKPTLIARIDRALGKPATRT